MPEDWNDVDTLDEQINPVDSSSDEDIPSIRYKETPDAHDTSEPIGAILKNVPGSVDNEKLTEILFEFNYKVLHYYTKYETNTIDYMLSIKNDPENTVVNKILKFKNTTAGVNITMDLHDLPKKKKNQGYQNKKNNTRIINQDGGYTRTNNRNYNNNKSQIDGQYPRSSYQNRSSQEGGYQHNSGERRNNSYQKSAQADGMPRTHVKFVSAKPEVSKLSVLTPKEIKEEEVDQSDIFGKGKPREEKIGEIIPPPKDEEISVLVEPSLPEVTVEADSNTRNIVDKKAKYTANKQQRYSYNNGNKINKNNPNVNSIEKEKDTKNSRKTNKFGALGDEDEE